MIFLCLYPSAIKLMGYCHCLKCLGGWTTGRLPTFGHHSELFNTVIGLYMDVCAGVFFWFWFDILTRIWSLRFCIWKWYMAVSHYFTWWLVNTWTCAFRDLNIWLYNFELFANTLINVTHNFNVRCVINYHIQILYKAEGFSSGMATFFENHVTVTVMLHCTINRHTHG